MRFLPHYAAVIVLATLVTAMVFGLLNVVVAAGCAVVLSEYIDRPRRIIAQIAVAVVLLVAGLAGCSSALSVFDDDACTGEDCHIGMGRTEFRPESYEVAVGETGLPGHQPELVQRRPGPDGDREGPREELEPQPSPVALPDLVETPAPVGDDAGERRDALRDLVLDVGLDPAQRVAVLTEYQAAAAIAILASFVVWGFLQVVLVLALFERLKDGSPAMAQTAAAVGLILATLAIAAGMVTFVGMEKVVELHAHDPEQAGALWLAVESVELGLTENENITGLWLLLVSWTALRVRQLPRALNYIGVVAGVAGLLAPGSTTINYA
jgi:hypothetical protein